MPLQTEHYWFEDLHRVKTLPVGDPEILTKHAPTPERAGHKFYLVRSLPFDESKEPLGVFYFFGRDPADGGSINCCVDFITHGQNFRDATIEFIELMMRRGIVLDDGTVSLPRTQTLYAQLPVLKRHVPAAVRASRGKPGDKMRPISNRAVLAQAMATTVVAGEMEHPTVKNTVDVEIVDYIEDENDPARVIVRWRRRGGS